MPAAELVLASEPRQVGRAAAVQLGLAALPEAPSEALDQDLAEHSALPLLSPVARDVFSQRVSPPRAAAAPASSP